MDFQPRIKVLDNGLKVLTVDLPQSQSTTALLMVKAGSRCEQVQQAGISHFLEHMVFKGVKKYPTAFKIASTVDSIGAEFNAFTSKEYTGFYIKSAANHLQLALEILHQLVFEPLLPIEEIEREKGVIIEEINMNNDMPAVKIGEDFESLLYGRTKLGRPVIGYKKNIRLMTRKDFLAYRSQWYQPASMVLSLSGPNVKARPLNCPFQPDVKARPLHGSSFDLRKFKPEEFQKLSFSQLKPALKVSYKKTEQAHLCLGVRAFPLGHPDRYAMALLMIILGGNMSSRLFTQVRERRGLAYYITSSAEAYFDNGYFVSQAGVGINKIYEAIKVILEEYKRISEKLIKKEELKKAKEYFKGKLALSLENSRNIAALFSEDLLLENKIRTPNQIIREIEKVTLSDIKRTAQAIFVNQGLNLAVIGPYQDQQKFEKIFRL